MNLFGTRERTNKALGVENPKEIGETMVGLMKPDIGGILKKPWTGLELAMQGMSMAPKKVRKGACQAVVMKDLDMTKLPIPTTWPMDGGPFITLPLVVTKDPKTGQHNMGMYRGQIFGKKEIGLHWQAHKHAADHADDVGKENRSLRCNNFELLDQDADGDQELVLALGSPFRGFAIVDSSPNGLSLTKKVRPDQLLVGSGLLYVGVVDYDGDGYDDVLALSPDGNTIKAQPF